jgi:hypothetical protein
MGLSLAGGVAAEPSALASGSVQLEAAQGQFFPVDPVKVLDTQDGTGGVSGPLAAGATAIAQVTGVGEIPPNGVTDVYAVISAINPAASGALEDYNTDVDNPGIWTVPFNGGGVNVTVSDMVQVSASGDISITNDSPGTVDVTVTVIGYVMGQFTSTPGDVYTALPETAILDTRSGLGAPQAKIPAGGSVTIRVAGQGGVPSEAAGVALFLGTDNAGATGYVSAYPTGGTDSGLAMLSYSPGRKVRNLYFGALSSSGQLTLVNHGSAPVDMMAEVEGYLNGPAATAGGSTYTSVDEQRIASTRDGTGGIPATPIPAGGSITFSATGVDSVPTSGVSAVVQTVAALNPTGSGYLSVYPAGGTDPYQPGVNFNSGDPQDNDLTAPLVSAVSPTGRVEITNHSSGTVDVVVALRGYYTAPTAPNTPDSVFVNPQSQTSATVSWEPPYGDGGAPITSYTVAASPDNQSVTVDPGTLTATLTGLTNAGADEITVTATNAYGSSAGADDEYMTVNPQAQAIESDVGVQIDTNAGTETLVDANANQITTNSSGVTASTPITPDPGISYVNNEAAAQALVPIAKIGCSYAIRNSKGARVVAFKWVTAYNGDGYPQSGVFAWINDLYSINKADINPYTNHYQWEAVVCTSGSGNTSGGSGWQATLSENAIVTNSAVNCETSATTCPLVNGAFGHDITSNHQVTETIGFNLGGQYQGASVGVTSTQDVAKTVNDSELNGHLGNTDFHYGLAWPSGLSQYDFTRLNTEWEADTPGGRTTSSVGNVGIVRYAFDDQGDGDNDGGTHVFWSVAIFASCLNGLCGRSAVRVAGN